MENWPVDMLSVCRMDGGLQPVRFRYEAPDHTVETVQISEIVSCKPISYVGVEALLYLCKARLREQERLMELKYTINTHRWVLFRVVY